MALEINNESWGQEIVGTVAEVAQHIQDYLAKGGNPNAEGILSIVTAPSGGINQIAAEMPDADVPISGPDANPMPGNPEDLI